MRIGYRRGLGLAVAMLGMLAGDASAGISDLAPWVHTIPRVTYARDLQTGGMYYAPPIPYGHYAKDPVGGVVGHVNGAKAHLTGKLHGLGGKLGGLGHDGLGHGSGTGHGVGHAGGMDGSMGHLDGAVHGTSLGHDGGLGLGHGGLGQGGAGHHGHVLGTPQFVPPSQIGGISCDPSICGGKHGALGGLLGGLGHGGHGDGLGHGGYGHGDGGMGHGGLGHGDGLGHGGLHGKLGHLKGLGHGALGALHGLHPGNGVRYFVGPGGPVPLTPGYVPYINVTRSPRDFFAFPPFSTRAFDY
jgi:hypothetical protein